MSEKMKRIVQGVYTKDSLLSESIRNVEAVFEGKMTAPQFISTEWADFTKVVEGLPADLQPAGQALLDSASKLISTAEDTAGTALATYVTNNSSALLAELQTLIQGAGLTTTVGPAAVDAWQSMLNMLLALVAHVVASLHNANPTPGGN